MAESSWVGGDIAGLHGMAQSMHGAPDLMNDTVHALSTKVQAIIGDAGWAGDAANQFTQKWTSDSVTAGALAEATRTVGDALGELATTLEEIDKALYDAAHTAQAQGVPIGPDGKPPTLAAPAQPSPDDQKKQRALQAYVEDYNRAMQAAKDARLVAEQKLRGVYDAVGPEDAGGGSGLTTSQAMTVGGAIKSLYAIPASRTRRILNNSDADLQQAKEEMRATRPEYQAAKKAYEAKGMNLPKDDPARVAHTEAASKLHEVEGRIRGAERGDLTNPVSKAMDTQLGDLSKGARVPKFLSFTKAINALGAVGTAVGAGVDTKNDVDKGDSPGRAAAVNYGSAGGGLAAGAVAAGAVADAPLVATAAVGTGVAVVVGGGIKEGINEHWSEDIDKHGVVGGVGVGLGNVAVNTGKDVSNVFSGIWHTVAG